MSDERTDRAAAASAAAAALEVESLRVRYGGVTAVDGISFSVRAGEVTVLLGANGAGKTSTLRGVGGLERTSRGSSVRLCGRELAGMDAAARARGGLGHCQEGRRVFAGLTVEENLALGRVARGSRKALAVDEIFAIFPELRERRRLHAGKLSGGQQQFLAVGRALIGAPVVLMLDEPTNGLAPMLVERVVEILRTLRDRGLAVVLVEQRLEVAQAVGDAVLLVSHGRIVHRLAAGDRDLPGLAHAVYMGEQGESRTVGTGGVRATSSR